jgi:hypothetical protein
MPDDKIHFITTASHDAAAQIIDDDHLIRGLASARHAADADAEAAYNVCCDAFDYESWQRYCDHEQRARTFLGALLSCQAEGLAGALAQMDAMQELDCVDIDESERLRALAHASIARVLRQCHGVLAVA